MLQLSHMMDLHDLVTALLHIPHGYLGGLGPGLGFMSLHCMRNSGNDILMLQISRMSTGSEVVCMHPHLSGGFLAPLGAWKLAE